MRSSASVWSVAFLLLAQTGKAQTEHGKYLTVYEKVNGEWKIVADTFNSDMPIPGM